MAAPRTRRSMRRVIPGRPSVSRIYARHRLATLVVTAGIILMGTQVGPISAASAASVAGEECQSYNSSGTAAACEYLLYSPFGAYDEFSAYGIATTTSGNVAQISWEILWYHNWYTNGPWYELDANSNFVTCNGPCSVGMQTAWLWPADCYWSYHVEVDYQLTYGGKAYGGEYNSATVRLPQCDDTDDVPGPPE